MPNKISITHIYILCFLTWEQLITFLTRGSHQSDFVSANRLVLGKRKTISKVVLTYTIMQALSPVNRWLCPAEHYVSTVTSSQCAIYFCYLLWTYLLKCCL